MAFKYPSRYDYGVKTIEHKGAQVTTSIHTEIEQVMENIPNKIPHRIGTCMPFITHRPDSISDIFYNTTALWWYIQLFNNIEDPFEGFNKGDRLLIPSKNGLPI